MAQEDDINSTNIHAGIGGQVLAASLVLLGIALSFFDLRNIEIFSWRGIFLLFAIFALNLSIITGAYGLKKLRDNGKTGNWDYSSTHCYFRVQTWSTFGALVIFAIVFISGGKPSNQDLALANLNQTLAKQYVLDSLKLSKSIETNQKIDSLIKIQHRQELLLKNLKESKSVKLGRKHICPKAIQ